MSWRRRRTFPRIESDGTHTTRIHVIVHRVRLGPLSSPSARSGGRKIQALRKENPSLREAKSKPWGRKIQAPSFPRIEPFQRVAPASRPFGHSLFFGRAWRNKIMWIKIIVRMCNCRTCPRIAVRGSTAARVLVAIGLAKRSDHGGMNHLSGDQIIRCYISESQEFVDELSLAAFARLAIRRTPTRLLFGLAKGRSSQTLLAPGATASQARRCPRLKPEGRLFPRRPS